MMLQEYTFVDAADGADRIQLLREGIQALGRESNSSLMLQKVSAEMSGKTFHHHMHVLYDLRTFLGPSRKVYLEIGVYNGASLALMMQHPFETEIHGIDPLILDGQVEHTFSNVKRFNIHGRCVAIHQTYSHDPGLLHELKDLSIDLLFVDGDHQQESVLHDFELYSPLVGSGGFIVFDDYLDFEFSPGVNPAVNRIVQRISAGAVSGRYDVIGTLPNSARADPVEMAESSVFILRRCD
jgi:predicted O-methyltransferase YrrM